MEVPNESQKRKLEETQEEATTETPKVVAAAEEPSAKKAKVDLDLNLQDITPAKIKKQIEYYFSDSNYRRDKWLQEEAAKHPEGCTASPKSPPRWRISKYLCNFFEFGLKFFRAICLTDTICDFTSSH
jgi:hypothetical protein